MSAWTAPQWIMTVFLIVTFIAAWLAHGKPHFTPNFDAHGAFTRTIIIALILGWAGFWRTP